MLVLRASAGPPSWRTSRPRSPRGRVRLIAARCQAVAGPRRSARRAVACSLGQCAARSRDSLEGGRDDLIVIDPRNSSGASVLRGHGESAAPRRGCCVKGAGPVVRPWWWGSRRGWVGGLAGSALGRVVGACLGPFRFRRWLSGACGASIGLWVAVISRHSERAADLPRRWKRSIRRLNLVFANTGSIIALRFRYSLPPRSVSSTRRMCA
jgi:hypothetical protein